MGRKSHALELMYSNKERGKSSRRRWRSSSVRLISWKKTLGDSTDHLSVVCRIADCRTMRKIGLNAMSSVHSSTFCGLNRKQATKERLPLTIEIGCCFSSWRERCTEVYRDQIRAEVRKNESRKTLGTIDARRRRGGCVTSRKRNTHVSASFPREAIEEETNRISLTIWQLSRRELEIVFIDARCGRWNRRDKTLSGAH